VVEPWSSITCLSITTTDCGILSIDVAVRVATEVERGEEPSIRSAVTVTGGRVVTVPTVCAWATVVKNAEAIARVTWFERWLVRLTVDFISNLSEYANNSADPRQAEVTHI
jgi:hypothetical protein